MPPLGIVIIHDSLPSCTVAAMEDSTWSTWRLKSFQLQLRLLQLLTLTCSLGSFDEPVFDHGLDFRLQLKVPGASVHRDNQRGNRQLPDLHKKVGRRCRRRVTVDATVLKPDKTDAW